MTEIGATYDARTAQVTFQVWAPLLKRVEVKIVSPVERIIPMEKVERGYWRVCGNDIPQGAAYVFRLNGVNARPDPASRFQPDGVHGPSRIVDHGAFRWNDDGWNGQVLDDYVIYELHAGTFTPEGTFESIIARLGYLRDLGVTAVELMPVAQFPGTRNWGYDGVYPFAVQNSYGGPTGLKQLVNACHERGLAVILDVVYNHLGPEGNYLRDFGPYFTDRYRTPWGDAINFDGPYSDEVRRYFVENALYWITDYHIDALRTDAIHGIFDFSARHFLHELGEAVHARGTELGRHIHVIAESDLNDVRVIKPVELGGWGLDAQWNDDFQHALHALLTGERTGYYGDFGGTDRLEQAFREGFVYSGQYSEFRNRRHGSSSKDLPPRRFIVFSQNHDQVGNRMRGERLSTLVSFEALKLAAGSVLLSPYLPLLFMGEEYGEKAPFLYFVSHSDVDLIEAVRKGRTEEFRAFSRGGEHPDPQSEETFLNSTIDLELRLRDRHRTLLEFYKTLLRLRRETAPFRHLSKMDMEVTCYKDEKALFVRRWRGNEEVFSLFHFSEEPHTVMLPLPKGRWEKILDSSDREWQGPGALLPGRLGSDDPITLRGHCIAVYFARKEE